MATSLTRNLKLRIDSNLTANAKYNLERIDLLGTTFLVDTTDNLNIRSEADIIIEPESADIGGSGVGGLVSLGTPSHILSQVLISTEELRVTSPISLLDQASGGTRDLLIQYKSDLESPVDTVSNRTLSISLEGADRDVVLGGDFQTDGNLTIRTTVDTDVYMPVIGTGVLATLSNIETLTNKSMDADDNTFVNFRNVNIASDASIVYSKLQLTGSIVNADIAIGAAIAYPKLNLSSSIVNNDISSSAAIQYSKLLLTSSIVNADISGSANISYGKLNLAGTILNSDLSPSFALDYSQIDLQGSVTDADIEANAGIQYSKLALTNSIEETDLSPSFQLQYSQIDLTNQVSNADIATTAAIAGSKIVPNFGNQNISAQGSLTLSNGSFSNTISTDAAQAANISYTLPLTAPTTGQLLQAGATPTELEWATVAGSGTVTSVALSLPSDIFDVSGSPVTGAGTLTATLDDQVQNTVWAGPASGADDTPAFRSLVTNDIPALAISKITGLQTALDGKQSLDATLTALAAYNTNGFLVQTAADTFTGRSLSAGTGISISNADGVAGNPSISTSITQYTDELAQDAVGGILTDSSSVTLAYSDATPSITATVLPAGVDHDALLNFVANEHVDHSSVQIATSATSGLSGGGDITTTRNIIVAPTLATSATAASGDTLLVASAANSNALRKITVQGILDLVPPPASTTYAADWTSGTTFQATHNLGTRDVTVQIYDITTYETLYVDSVIRTTTNTVDFTSSQAPTGSGWRVLISP